MSNLGPLTTTFTPASPDCVSSLHIRRKDTAGWDLVLGLPGSHSSSCLPTSFTWSSAYYSPGICPSGHTYACTETDAVGDEITTIATCCPSGWVCRNDKNAAFACVLRFPTQTTLYDVGSYQVSTPSGGSTTVLREGTPQDLTLSAGFQAYAWGPVVRRQSTDETWPVRTATAGASSTVGASSTASSSLFLSSNAAAAAATSSTSTSNGSSGLSTGAKAGIGVGVAVGGLLVISACIAAFVLRRRRRQRQSAKGTAVQEMPVNQEPQWAGPPGELHGESRQEMPGEGVEKDKPAELPGAYR